MNRKRSLLIPLAISVVGLTFLFLGSAGAATVSFSVPIHADIDHVPVGTQFVSTTTVPQDAQGRTCTVSTQNGESVHTGASVAFTSASSVTLQGTEETSGAQRSGSITLGTTITATATTGQDPAYDEGDGGFSLGAAQVSCPDVPTTTTLPVVTTTPPPAPPVPPSPPAAVVTVRPGFTG